MRIENQDGEAVAFKFVAADGLWIGIEPLVPASDVEQTGLPGLVAALGGVRVISVLAGGPAATDLGLAPANFESVITLTDGSTQSLSIGDAAPTSSGYYVISNDDDTPKLVSKPALDQLIGLVDNPPIIPTPTLTATITSTLGITGTVTVTPTIDLTATD